jgi:hypothetical protein
MRRIGRLCRRRSKKKFHDPANPFFSHHDAYKGSFSNFEMAVRPTV